ncbi:MAG: hypothetical protein ACRD4K_12145, partial [Candidatus Acidiferrales bacterium]
MHSSIPQIFPQVEPPEHRRTKSENQQLPFPLSTALDASLLPWIHFLFRVEKFFGEMKIPMACAGRK